MYKSVNIILVMLVGFFLLTASYSETHQINHKPQIVRECCGCCCGIPPAADGTVDHDLHKNCQCRVEQAVPPTEIPLDLQISTYNPDLSAALTAYLDQTEFEINALTPSCEPVINFDDTGPPLFIINSSFLI